MSRRYAFSNDTVATMIRESGNGWTMDIPNASIVRAFPLRGDDGMLLVTPARESRAGRGQPVFDVWNPALPDASGVILWPTLISFKISAESRNPRSIVITTGKGRHVNGVLGAIVKGTAVPLVAYNYIEEEDQWYRLNLNVSRILSEVAPVEANGQRGNIAVLSRAPRRSGRDEFGEPKVIVYTSLRINVAPCVKAGFSEGWVKVDAPCLPEKWEAWM